MVDVNCNRIGMVIAVAYFQCDAKYQGIISDRSLYTSTLGNATSNKSEGRIGFSPPSVLTSPSKMKFEI